jgi:hypothetical protein
MTKRVYSDIVPYAGVKNAELKEMLETKGEIVSRSNRAQLIHRYTPIIYTYTARLPNL